MLALGELEKSRRYIEARYKEKNNIDYPVGPCITISRETGTCAKCISEELVKFLNRKSYVKEPEWTIFDKNLIDKVIEDHNLPGVLKSLMVEEKVSFFASMINEMLSGLPGQWTLIQKQMETILHLASIGNVIFIGRGAHIIIQELPHSFHVRLVAPFAERIKKFAELHKIDLGKARTIVEQHDVSRSKYIQTVFNRKPDDTSLFNLVINTKGLTFRQIAKLIGTAVIERHSYFFSNRESLITGIS